MSSYVVDDATINKVVAYLYFEAMDSRSNGEIARKLRNLDYNLLSMEDCKRLAEDMFSLNVRAVNQRYGEGEAEKFRSLDFKFQLQSPTSLIKTLKAFECWSYQCCEGDVILSNLYKALGQVAIFLAWRVVHGLPEWEKEGWG